MYSITINGETKSAKEWAEISPVTYRTILRRIKKYGTDAGEKLIGESSCDKERLIEHSDTIKSVGEWADDFNIERETMYTRLLVNDSSETQRIFADRGSFLGVQKNNIKYNRAITINGVTKTVAEWAKVVGISLSSMRMRVEKYGVDAGEILIRLKQKSGSKPKMVEIGGEQKTIKELADEVGILYESMRRRIEKHGVENIDKIMAPRGDSFGTPSKYNKTGGYKTKELANMFNISNGYVSLIRKKHIQLLKADMDAGRVDGANSCDTLRNIVDNFDTDKLFCFFCPLYFKGCCIRTEGITGVAYNIIKSVS